jgi:hypothetical protein
VPHARPSILSRLITGKTLSAGQPGQAPPFPTAHGSWSAAPSRLTSPSHRGEDSILCFTPVSARAETQHDGSVGPEAPFRASSGVAVIVLAFAAECHGSTSASVGVVAPPAAAVHEPVRAGSTPFDPAKIVGGRCGSNLVSSDRHAGDRPAVAGEGFFVKRSAVLDFVGTVEVMLTCL